MICIYFTILSVHKLRKLVTMMLYLDSNQMYCYVYAIRFAIFAETIKILKKCVQNVASIHIKNVVEDFMNYLGKLNEKFKRIILKAHNTQKCDSHFILKYMNLHSTGVVGAHDHGDCDPTEQECS